jgi:hypothetical protein
MKAINTLALVAFVITLTAYFMSAGTASAPAESGGDRTVTDLLPTRRQPAPVKAEIKQPAAKQTAEPNPVLDIIQSGNICALEANRKKKNFMTDKQDFAALAAVIDPSPGLAEFLSATGPILATEAPKKKYTSRAARLAWAMRLAGNNTLASVPEDLKESRKLLLELEKEDPANSALPFLRLGIEKKMQLDPKELAETENKISDGSDFNTYFEDLGEELESASWQNTITYRFVEHMGYYVLPSLNLYDGTSALQTSTTLSPDAKKRIVLTMKQRALRAKLPFTGRNFNADVYENARSLDHDEQEQSIYQLSAEQSHNLGIEPLNFPSIISSPECDSRDYEEYYYANKGRH